MTNMIIEMRDDQAALINGFIAARKDFAIRDISVSIGGRTAKLRDIVFSFSDDGDFIWKEKQDEPTN